MQSFEKVWSLVLNIFRNLCSRIGQFQDSAAYKKVCMPILSEPGSKNPIYNFDGIAPYRGLRRHFHDVHEASTGT